MKEVIMDELLNIKTQLADDWKLGSDPHYNRNEPTPYHVLTSIVNEYQPKVGGELVDFGCGRGRAMIFLAHHWRVKVTGVEFNDQLITPLKKNITHYISDYPEDSELFEVAFIPAEYYSITNQQSAFYFFNPFSIEIFKTIIWNILASYDEYPREIDLILYYAYPEFIQFLNQNTAFELELSVKLCNQEINPREKWRVYRLRG